MSYVVLFWCGILIIDVGARRNDLASMDVYKQCSLITEPVCQDVRYTHTRMPNSIGIFSQNEASKRIRDYYPLINLQCSQYLKLYLCSIYFPICDKDSSTMTPAIQPCRRLCDHVKSRCEPFMKEAYQLSWPNELDCERLPSTGKMCLSPDSFNLDKDIDKEPTFTDTKKKLFEKFQLMRQRNGQLSPQNGANLNTGLFSNSKCLPSHVDLGQSPNISCFQRCEVDVKFNEDDKAFANIWLIGWSLLCLLSSLFTIITFSCNTNRFMYPEKPIVFLSICYFFHACGNLLGSILGRKNVICRSINEQLDFMVDPGYETTWCKVTFLMVYYFSSASALWWVVLTVTWFLSASRHWGYEAIESISSILHLISWGIPAVKSIFVLILHKIDADELTGLCFVGNTDRESMVAFILAPQIIYLVTGITFLGAGYISILKVRKSLLEQPNSSYINNLKRLEKLMAKIGIFSILYIIPVTCTLSSYAVDAFKTSHFDLTLKALYEFSSDCVSTKGLSWSLSKCVDIIQSDLPSVEMRMLRIFMNLVIGITSGIWIWGNKKTFQSGCCFMNDLKHKKDIEMKDMKQKDVFNSVNGFPFINTAECNMQLQQWNFGPNFKPVPVSSMSMMNECILATNNTSVAGISSMH